MKLCKFGFKSKHMDITLDNYPICIDVMHLRCAITSERLIFHLFLFIFYFTPPLKQHSKTIFILFLHRLIILCHGFLKW